MLDIFVCEDDVKQREKINECIQNYIMIEQLDMRLAYSTNDPIQLIKRVQSNVVNGLYFLDVNLEHEMSGIILGAEIRKLDPQATIVFITTHAELTSLTFVYKVEALDYIIKNNYENIHKRVIECINIVNARKKQVSESKGERFQVKVGDKVITEDFQDILYFETSTSVHKITMHTKNRSVEFYGRMKDLSGKYAHFYRCHNSIIINIKNILEIDRKNRKIFMENGAECQASIRYMKGLVDVCNVYNLSALRKEISIT